MTEARRCELMAKLGAMQAVSDAFYASAWRIGVHPFIEITGFMNEYIKIARENLKKGVDFAEANAHTQRRLEVAPHQVAYLGEKLNCILGPALSNDPALKAAFVEAISRAG